MPDFVSHTDALLTLADVAGLLHEWISTPVVVVALTLAVGVGALGVLSRGFRSFFVR